MQQLWRACMIDIGFEVLTPIIKKHNKTINKNKSR